MKKLMVILLSIVMAAMFLSPATADYKAEYKLDIVPSITTGWGMGAQYFTELVKERSGGKINIKVYPNSQLSTGQQTNAFMLLRNGTIDFACQSTINYSPQVPELNLFALPFFFASQPDRYKALDAVTNGKAGELIAKAIEAKGAKFLCFGENGFRELSNCKHPITGPADLGGLKVRVVGSPLFLDSFKAIGSNPVTMAWSDTISAIQQGVVDGQENPIAVYQAAKLHTVAQKHITMWGYVNDPLIFVVNKDIWNSWTPADREIVKQAAIDAGKEEIAIARKGMVEADKPLLKEIAANGVTVTQLSAAEREAFVKATRPVYDKWKNQIGADLVTAAEKAIAARK